MDSVIAFASSRHSVVANPKALKFVDPRRGCATSYDKFGSDRDYASRPLAPAIRSAAARSARPAILVVSWRTVVRSK